MNDFPQDNAILLSFLNMKLRDEYASLDELCDALDFERALIEEKMRAYGYAYDGEKNRFC